MTNSKISLATARVNAGYTQKKVAERLNRRTHYQTLGKR